MTTYLLDGSVVIPLAGPEHVHHESARRWFAGIQSFALCPIVEGALVRYMIRVGAPLETVARTLRGYHGHPAFEFWTDSVSYADLDLARVHGYHQVTDAYLVRLAESHGDALLATYDKALASTYPGLTFLVPSS